MTSRGPATLTICVLALVAGAGAVIVAGSCRSASSRATSREFQTIVGGLGLGPALDLARCAPAFDPRVGALCAERTGPIPAGDAFSPDHASAVLPP